MDYCTSETVCLESTICTIRSFDDLQCCFAHSELVVVCFRALKMQSVHHIFLLCIEWLCSLLMVVVSLCVCILHTLCWRAAVNIPLENPTSQSLLSTFILLYLVFTQANWPFQSQPRLIRGRVEAVHFLSICLFIWKKVSHLCFEFNLSE